MELNIGDRFKYAHWDWVVVDKDDTYYSLEVVDDPARFVNHLRKYFIHTKIMMFEIIVHTSEKKIQIET